MQTDVVKQTERTVQEMKKMAIKFKANTISKRADVAALTDQWQLLHKTKFEVKEEFHNSLTLNTFMQNLAAPREEWDSLIALSEEQLHVAKVSQRQAKHMVDEEKQKIMELNAAVEQGITLFEQNLQILKEKFDILQNMSSELDSLKENKLGTGANENDGLQKEVRAELTRIGEEIKKCHKEMLWMEHAMSERQMEISQVQDDVQRLLITLGEDVECMNEKILSRLQKSLVEKESLNGVTCTNIGNNTVVVEFPPKGLPNQPANNGLKDDLILKVTFTFKENSLHFLCLSGVECNMDSLEIRDLWQADSKEDVNISLPELINNIKQRWLCHVPLLSEVNKLRTKFAIDWIQQENILRVIVGKGGSIVCSLQIPQGYPRLGKVVLTNLMGSTDDVTVEDLVPPGNRNLEDWMQFLENMFGKP